MLKIIHQANSFTDSSVYSLVALDSKSEFKCGYVKSEFIGLFYSDFFNVDHQNQKISITIGTKTTETLNEICLEWKKKQLHPSLLKWRSEQYAVYDPTGQVAFTVERSACGIFGFRQYGCHLNAFTIKDSETKIWIAKRSLQKQTWPGMLDNTVAGGLPAGLCPRDNIIKEAMEEASIPYELAKNVKSTGIISFFADLPDRGLIPDTEFVYDLQVDHDFEPKPLDGEVDSFYLMTIPEASLN